MNDNCGIIKGSVISTKNGEYVCTGLWMGKEFSVIAFDFSKVSDGPLSNAIQIKKELIVDRLEKGEIKVVRIQKQTI